MTGVMHTPPTQHSLIGALILMGLPGCTQDTAAVGDLGSGSGVATDSTDGGTGGTGGETDSGATGASTTGGTAGGTGVKFDVGGAKFDVGETTGGGGSCVVSDGLDAPMACDQKAPPNSFDPVLEWSWDPVDSDPQLAGWRGTSATPLVINLTDDDGNGTIDLCDTPDIVVTLEDPNGVSGDTAVAILDGATGAMHYFHDHINAAQWYSGAAGDIDGDGVAELIMMEEDAQWNTNLVAFEADGTVLWRGEGAPGHVALADLDADGDVEIINADLVADHLGNTLFFANIAGRQSVPVDLDGDGDLEIIIGDTALHHDGSVYWKTTDLAPGQTPWPAIADVDGDGMPEVIMSTVAGVTVLEHDGQLKTATTVPVGAGFTPDDLARPATLADFNGDGTPGIGQVLSQWNVQSVFGVFDHQLGAMHWVTNVHDNTGASGATAFDFLGDGSAETILTDEQRLLVMDGVTGNILVEQPRQSRTLSEYPVVADVDNDGSAEIVVTSSREGFGGQPAPTIQVFGEKDSRWVGSRRIWNQHAYHITNVREDGTIPQVQPKNWESFNNFRVNAQVEMGGECVPPQG